MIFRILIAGFFALQTGIGFCQELYFDRHYRAVLETPGGELPFSLQLNYYFEHCYGGEIQNGDEIINVAPGWKGDSFQIILPVFNTEITAKFSDDKKELNGRWYDRSRTGNYYLPFKAVKIDSPYYRFLKDPLPPKANISGRYDAIFKDESSSDSTIAVLKQDGNYLTGTFLTTSGDYRFLEGQVSGDSLFLSTFNGAHAYLFKGKIHDNGELTMEYWTGKHYHANIIAIKNDQAKLPDPQKLTYLKPGYDHIDFAFPDENGKLISLRDTAYQNKPVVIMITGTWCGNCMDEASYMSEVEEKYKNTDLRLIALSFERQTDSVNFKKNIVKFKSHFGLDYPFLNAGLPKNAGNALPMLNHVMSYPTTIILDSDHHVEEIHTGFTGPATGDLFVAYQKEFEAMLNRLLEE